MTMAYLAQPEEQQKLEWLDGGQFAVLLDSAATMRPVDRRTVLRQQGGGTAVPHAHP